MQDDFSETYANLSINENCDNSRLSSESSLQNLDDFNQVLSSNNAGTSNTIHTMAETEEKDTTENENETSLVMLPSDPRVWNMQHIETWINWITKQFNLDPAPISNRFPESGKELCTLSKADFWVCAGSREGGNKLATHFAHLLYSVTGEVQSHLLNDNDPGNKIKLSLLKNLDR